MPIDIQQTATAIGTDLFGAEATTATPETQSEQWQGQETAQPEDSTTAVATDTPAASSSDGTTDPPASDGSSATTTDPTETPQAQDTPTDPYAAPPRTWKPIPSNDWAKLPANVREEIYRREQDIFSGINQYRELALVGQEINKASAPYRHLFAASNTSPADVYKNFLAAHIQLSSGSPAQRQATLKQLAQNYRLTPGDFGWNVAAGQDGNQQTAQPQQPVIDPTVERLHSTVSRLESQIARQTELEAVRERSALENEVVQFASANPYFNDVAESMAQLIQGGVAKTLQEAYQHAIWANPTIRQKLISAANTGAPATAPAPVKPAVQKRVAASATVQGKSASGTGTSAARSIDDTMQETLREIRLRSQ